MTLEEMNSPKAIDVIGTDAKEKVYLKLGGEEKSKTQFVFDVRRTCGFDYKINIKGAMHGRRTNIARLALL